MNRFGIRTLALVCTLAVTPLFAQQQRQPGGFGFGGGGGEKSLSMLVGNKSVQEELKLTDDQVAKFKTANEAVREKFKTEMKDAGKDREKMTALFKTMAEESSKVMTKTMDEVLKPEQTKRLKQIHVQVNTTYSLANSADLQKTLKMTESQIGEIKAISDDAAKDTRELMKGARGPGADQEKAAENRKKVAEITKEAGEKIVGKLSTDQKKQLDEMSGPKFELKTEQRTRPGL